MRKKLEKIPYEIMEGIVLFNESLEKKTIVKIKKTMKKIEKELEYQKQELYRKQDMINDYCNQFKGYMKKELSKLKKYAKLKKMVRKNVRSK